MSDSFLKEGEKPLYTVIDHDKPQDTDRMPGEHIITLIQFANAQWTSEANWGLLKDLEDKALLFPNIDTATYEISLAQDKITQAEFKKKNPGKELILVDSLEDCAQEIEDLKDELTNIIYTRTPAGRERWDTPEVLIDKQKKGNKKKDRYSALLMANWLSRSARTKLIQNETYESKGGLVRNIKGSSKNNKKTLYSGPEWFISKANVINYMKK